MSFGVSDYNAKWEIQCKLFCSHFKALSNFVEISETRSCNEAYHTPTEWRKTNSRQCLTNMMQCTILSSALLRFPLYYLGALSSKAERRALQPKYRMLVVGKLQSGAPLERNEAACIATSGKCFEKCKMSFFLRKGETLPDQDTDGSFRAFGAILGSDARICICGMERLCWHHVYCIKHLQHIP